MFEECGRRTDDDLDGRTTEPAYAISSPMSLKAQVSLNTKTNILGIWSGHYVDIFILTFLRHTDVCIQGFIYISITSIYQEMYKYNKDFQKVIVLCYHGYIIWRRNSNVPYIFC